MRQQLLESVGQRAAPNHLFVPSHELIEDDVDALGAKDVAQMAVLFENRGALHP